MYCSVLRLGGGFTNDLLCSIPVSNNHSWIYLHRSQEYSTVDYLPTPTACHTWLVCILKQGVVQSRSFSYLIWIKHNTGKKEALEIIVLYQNRFVWLHNYLIFYCLFLVWAAQGSWKLHGPKLPKGSWWWKCLSYMILHSLSNLMNSKQMVRRCQSQTCVVQVVLALLINLFVLIVYISYLSYFQ